MFILFNELIDDRVTQMKRVCSFLGVDDGSEFKSLNKHKNKPRIPHSRIIQRLISQALSSDFDDPRVIRYAKGLLRRLAQGVNHWKASEHSRQLEPEVHSYLSDVLRNEVEQLEELIGRDLSHWKCN